MAANLFDKCPYRSGNGSGGMAVAARITVRKASPIGSNRYGTFVGRTFSIFIPFHGRARRWLACLGMDRLGGQRPSFRRLFALGKSPRAHWHNSFGRTPTSTGPGFPRRHRRDVHLFRRTHFDAAGPVPVSAAQPESQPLPDGTFAGAILLWVSAGLSLLG